MIWGEGADSCLNSSKGNRLNNAKKGKGKFALGYYAQLVYKCGKDSIQPSKLNHEMTYCLVALGDWQA